MSMHSESQSGPPKPELDLDEAVQRMGDAALYREIAAFFAGNITTALANLEEALAALPFPTGPPAAENDAMMHAKRLAHSFKGNCATVGAEALRAEALRLETLLREGNSGEARQAFARFKSDMMKLKVTLEEICKTG